MALSTKLLITAVALPVFGSFLIPFTSRLSTSLRNAFAVLLGLLTFLAAAALLRPVFHGQVISMALNFPLGFDFILQADMLSVFMAVVSAFVSLIILIYSVDYISHY